MMALSRPANLGTPRVLAGVCRGSSVDGQYDTVGPSSRPVLPCGWVHSPPLLRPARSSARLLFLVQVDRARRTITLTAEARPSAFLASTDPDPDRYHALVSRSGGAVAKATDGHRRRGPPDRPGIRSLGAEDAGGVPMSAWNRRGASPSSPARAPGWLAPGGGPHHLGGCGPQLHPGGSWLGEEGPGEVENPLRRKTRSNDHHWPSGCNHLPLQLPRWASSPTP